MRSFRGTRRDGATHDDRGGASLAKGPALVVGTALVAFGLAALLTNSDFPSTSANFPDGTAQGETFLGFEVNGWTGWGAIAAGALLLFGLARHWVAKTMSLLVGLALGAAAVIAVIDGEDVLGLAAANGWTKLGLGIASAVLLVTALLPRAGRRHRDHDTQVVAAEPDRRVVADEPVAEHEPENERTARFARDAERAQAQSSKRA